MINTVRRDLGLTAVKAFISMRREALQWHIAEEKKRVPHPSPVIDAMLTEAIERRTGELKTLAQIEAILDDNQKPEPQNT